MENFVFDIPFRLLDGSYFIPGSNDDDWSKIKRPKMAYNPWPKRYWIPHRRLVKMLSKRRLS